MALRTARGADDADRRESRLVTAVVAEGFVNRLGFGIVTFALPLYALELGMGIAEIGLLVSAKALLQPAVKPLVGIAVDRWGTRRSYLASVGFRFLAALALLFSFTPAALFGVRLLQGLASAAGDPVSISVLAKGRSDRVSRRFSHVYAARDVGKVSAGLVGGLVLAATGSFTALWVVVVVLAAVPLLIVWSFVHELPDRPQAAAVEQDLPEEVERILRSPRLRTIAMLGLFGGLTATMTHALFQVYAAEVAGLDNGQIGLVYSVAVGALLVVGPLAGWVGDRHGHGPLASARALSNVVSSVVLLLFPTFAGVLFGRLVDEGGKAAFRPTWGSLLAQAARRARGRGGRTAAGLDAWLSLGEALGPLVAGLIWDLAGVAWFLVVRALLGVGTELVLGRRLRVLLREPDEPAAPPAVLRAGPGVLELRAVAVGGGDPVDLVVRPGAREVLPGGVPADELVAALRAGGRPAAGTVLLDGQDLAAVPAGAGPAHRRPRPGAAARGRTDRRAGAARRLAGRVPGGPRPRLAPLRARPGRAARRRPPPARGRARPRGHRPGWRSPPPCSASRPCWSSTRPRWPARPPSATRSPTCWSAGPGRCWRSPPGRPGSPPSGRRRCGPRSSRLRTGPRGRPRRGSAAARCRGGGGWRR